MASFSHIDDNGQVVINTDDLGPIAVGTPTDAKANWPEFAAEIDAAYEAWLAGGGQPSE
jgi:hypothetical protein